MAIKGISIFLAVPQRISVFHRISLEDAVGMAIRDVCAGLNKLYLIQVKQWLGCFAAKGSGISTSLSTSSCECTIFLPREHMTGDLFKWHL
jgi:hypothetical protein